MIIDSSNYGQGNRALASVLLLYYHILREGGITNDQTVYLDPDDFNGFDYLEVQVAPEDQNEIDQKILREGAVIYLLCDLDDMVSEYEDDFLKQPLVQRIVAEHAAGRLSAVPEAEAILSLLMRGEQSFDYADYRRLLSSVFEKYVLARFRALTEGSDR